MDTSTETPRVYVQDTPDELGRLIAKGMLKTGIKIDSQPQLDFVMREATTGDMFAAEKLAPVDRAITYNAAMLCQQLVSIGTFKGPFTLALLGKIKRGDFATLRAAQEELAVVGEA